MKINEEIRGQQIAALQRAVERLETRVSELERRLNDPVSTPQA